MSTLAEIEKELAEVVEYIRLLDARGKPSGNAHDERRDLEKEITRMRHVEHCEAALAALETAHRSAVAGSKGAAEVRIAHLAMEAALDCAKKAP